MVDSWSEHVSSGNPLVPRCRVILEHLQRERSAVTRDSKVTSVLWEREAGSKPPTTRIFPLIIEARASANILGKEAREVHFFAPGSRVTTEVS